MLQKTKENIGGSNMTVDRKDVPKHILEYYGAKNISVGSKFELYEKKESSKEAKKYREMLNEFCKKQEVNME